MVKKRKKSLVPYGKMMKTGMRESQNAGKNEKNRNKPIALVSSNQIEEWCSERTRDKRLM
jgi:hypothetical protein